MSSGARTFAGLFGVTDFMIPMVLGDLSDEQAYERPRGDGGPSIAWTIGHLLNYRIFLLQRFGVDSENPYADRFGNAPATDGSGYPTLEELGSAWTEIGTAFAEALAGLSEDRLDAKLEDGWHEEQTLRDQVVFLAWHEGYHMGAIGQMRKALGLSGPAERVAEVREATADDPG